MENSKEKTSQWLSVPQFGDWEQKGVVPDYSVDFSKIREMRKQHKRDPSRASLGNEEEFINPPNANSKLMTVHSSDNLHDGYNQSHRSPTRRRSIFSCFNCCVKA